MNIHISHSRSQLIHRFFKRLPSCCYQVFLVGVGSHDGSGSVLGCLSLQLHVCDHSGGCECGRRWRHDRNWTMGGATQFVIDDYCITE